MLNSKEFYEKENRRILEKYENEILIIKEICNETKNSMMIGELKEYYKFFNHVGNFALKLYELEKTLNDDYFSSRSFDELKNENYKLYEEIIGENYNASYANPSYSVSIFGDGLGQLLSAFYAKCRTGISFAYKHRLFSMEENNYTLIEAFNYVKNNKVCFYELKNIMFCINEASMLREETCRRKEVVNNKFGFYLNIILKDDITDTKYLFKFDKYISENEIKTAEFLSKYPKKKIETLSKAIVEAYLRGFVVENKNRENRNHVVIAYNIGQEIIIKQIIKEFQCKGFTSTVAEIISTEANKQYNYDHRFDNSLYINDDYLKLRESVYERVCNLFKDDLAIQSGILVFESFGETPFSPEKKNHCLKLSEKQKESKQQTDNKIDEIYENFSSSKNTSFCIVSLPSAEIGENFEEIFEEVLQINMMDNALYETIQQSLIDVLDKGEYVHIKGKGSNKTDIKVKLPKLKNPERETNFVNCVADVNIPLGEVYTSPELKGTNGVLHIEDIYLGLRFKNLKLTFKDGYAVDYTCTNFGDDTTNKEYVKENLMDLHDTLPLGEFAIGTNTAAYVMAQKYDIVEILPILIVEKMGPHFAIGDTCFSWSEDLPVYNILNNKEIVARDNEKSILRKEDINKAYTGIHTDITLPYEGIEFISVITNTGENIELIKDGRFVLKGTEELNKVFEH